MIRTCVWAATHVGAVRRRNEDSLGATGLLTSSVDGEVVMIEVSGESCLAVVADGLGGHPCGDLASRLAVEHLMTVKPVTSDELAIAMREANDLIYEEMQRSEGSTGMGTTVAAVLLHDGGLTVVNVGDSQVFELIEGRLVQLSIDDVLPGRGDLPGLSSARVTQTLGGQARRTAIKPHVYEDDVVTERQLLLCTDGLTNFVPRSQIAEALALGASAAVEALIGLALAAGGHDNITVVMLDVRWNGCSSRSATSGAPIEMNDQEE